MVQVPVLALAQAVVRVAALVLEVGQVVVLAAAVPQEPAQSRALPALAPNVRVTEIAALSAVNLVPVSRKTSVWAAPPVATQLVVLLVVVAQEVVPVQVREAVAPVAVLAQAVAVLAAMIVRLTLWLILAAVYRLIP